MRELERVLKAIANRRRLAIIQHLKSGEAKVSDIAAEIHLSLRATSKHLMVLFAADVVDKEKRSLEVWYRLSPTSHRAVKYVNSLLG